MEESRARHEADLIETLQNKMDEQYKKTQEQMDICYNKLNSLVQEQREEFNRANIEMNEKISTIKDDVLSIEGAYFRSECRRLLKKDHVITEEEFNTISVEHAAYKSLGGNHEGDTMFNMIETKYKVSLKEGF